MIVGGNKAVIGEKRTTICRLLTDLRTYGRRRSQDELATTALARDSRVICWVGVREQISEWVKGAALQLISHYYGERVLTVPVCVPTSCRMTVVFTAANYGRQVSCTTRAFLLMRVNPSLHCPFIAIKL